MRRNGLLQLLNQGRSVHRVSIGQPCARPWMDPCAFHRRKRLLAALPRHLLRWTTREATLEPMILALVVPERGTKQTRASRRAHRHTRCVKTHTETCRDDQDRPETRTDGLDVLKKFGEIITPDPNNIATPLLCMISSRIACNAVRRRIKSYSDTTKVQRFMTLPVKLGTIIYTDNSPEFIRAFEDLN